mmetsp:Transcript_47365/g.94475  ORF Transcript_47365/g.94475 Transcript_47365/m.94475 type:complete len:245 (+) Transcript_47365:1514-2248(+)
MTRRGRRVASTHPSPTKLARSSWPTASPATCCQSCAAWSRTEATKPTRSLWPRRHATSSRSWAMTTATISPSSAPSTTPATRRGLTASPTSPSLSLQTSVSPFSMAHAASRRTSTASSPQRHRPLSLPPSPLLHASLPTSRSVAQPPRPSCPTGSSSRNTSKIPSSCTRRKDTPMGLLALTLPDGRHTGWACPACTRPPRASSRPLRRPSWSELFGDCPHPSWGKRWRKGGRCGMWKEGGRCGM